MNTTKTLVPPKNRKEWELLVTAKLHHNFQNFVLQIKSAEFSHKIALGKMDKQQAIDELYELCTKYAGAVQNDFCVIFKKW